MDESDKAKDRAKDDGEHNGAARDTSIYNGRSPDKDPGP